MLVYLGAGAIWAWWLEYYTTKHLSGIMETEWKWAERFFHIALWPATLGHFLFVLFRNR